MKGFVDLHSHLVPGVDDGARSTEEALEAIERLAGQGVVGVITTPHLDASVIGRQGVFDRVQRVAEERWAEVVTKARERHPGMRFGLGREIMLDTPLFDLEDSRLRLAGGPYVLVEFPRLNIPPGSGEALSRIGLGGHRPVVAHVERYHYDGDPRVTLEEWREVGAALQVNLASLLGLYGPAAEDLAWRLLRRGWADMLATDHHARGEPKIERALAVLKERGGADVWRALTETNPRRVLAGEALLPPPPLQGPVPRGGPLRRLVRRVLRPPVGPE